MLAYHILSGGSRANVRAVGTRSYNVVMVAYFKKKYFRSFDAVSRLFPVIPYRFIKWSKPPDLIKTSVEASSWLKNKSYTCIFFPKRDKPYPQY